MCIRDRCIKLPFFLITILRRNAPTSRVLLASFRVLLEFASNTIVAAPAGFIQFQHKPGHHNFLNDLPVSSSRPSDLKFHILYLHQNMATYSFDYRIMQLYLHDIRQKQSNIFLQEDAPFSRPSTDADHELGRFPSKPTLSLIHISEPTRPY